GRAREPAHPALVAQRFAQRVPQNDADVLDRVVQVDLEVALRLDGEVESRVLSELFDHVVEERDAGGDARRSGSVDDKRDGDGRLLGLTPQLGAPRRRTDIGHRTTSGRASPSAARNASFSAGVPTVTRKQPSIRGHEEKSRTRTSWASRRFHNS